MVLNDILQWVLFCSENVALWHRTEAVDYNGVLIFIDNFSQSGLNALLLRFGYFTLKDAVLDPVEVLPEKLLDVVNALNVHVVDYNDVHFITQRIFERENLTVSALSR